MNKTSFLKHKISLFLIFILGNTLIVFPKGVGVESAIISVIIAALPTVFISFFYFKTSAILKQLPKLFEILIVVFCTFVFIITALDYINFVDSVRLPKTPRFIISFFFVVLTVILGFAKRKVIYLISLFSILITTLIILSIFLTSIKNFNFSSIGEFSFDSKVLIRQSLTFFIHSFGQILIPILFVKDNLIFKNRKIIILGLVGSFLLMLIYVLNIILVLGADVTAKVAYPYATLTSYISFGRNFSRLDGFTYYIYFFSSLIKCSVCVAVVLDFFKIKRKTAAILITTVLLIASNLDFLQNFLHTDFFNLIVLIFEILFPISAFIYQKIKYPRK